MNEVQCMQHAPSARSMDCSHSSWSAAHMAWKDSSPNPLKVLVGYSKDNNITGHILETREMARSSYDNCNSNPYIIIERSRKREASDPSPFYGTENELKDANLQVQNPEKKCAAFPFPTVHSTGGGGFRDLSLKFPGHHFANPDSSASSTSSLSEELSVSTTDSLPYGGSKSHRFNPGSVSSTVSSDFGPSNSSGFSARSGSIHEELNSLCLTDKSPSSTSFSVSTSGTETSHSLASSMEDDDYEQKRTSKLPLWFSLFQNVPPKVYFGSENEHVLPFPSEVKELLLWKLTVITPILIRQTVKRSGYQLTKKSNKWVGTWSKHMKCAQFRGMKDFQKVNHYPGSFHLGRKDRLCRNLSKMQCCHEDDFAFFPDTFVLPQDTKALRKVWDQAANHCWIIKPPASARGTGVHVIHKWSQIPKKQPVIVQRYLADPYLINGTKFDLRVYVLISSFDPLKIFVFDDGLVRFASVKYTLAMGSLGDRFVHLTNYSINKNSSTYKANQNESVCQGHKWTLKALWRYLSSQGVDTGALWRSIIDIVIKTILSCEAPIRKLISNHTQSRYSCFELFGFDIMLDHLLRPWLLEVNVSPSLHSASSLDVSVKGQLVKDMLNIVGFMLPPKVSSVLKTPFSVDGLQLAPEAVCQKRQLHAHLLSEEEKIKHRNYERRFSSQESILARLTPDDVRCLVEAEDELVRCGHFQRVFPTASSRVYFKYLSHVTYYNRLLDAWEQRYFRNRDPGIKLLQGYCENRFHLCVPQPLTVSQEAKIPKSESRSSAAIISIMTKTEVSSSVVLKVGGRFRRKSMTRSSVRKLRSHLKEKLPFAAQPVEQ